MGGERKCLATLPGPPDARRMAVPQNSIAIVFDYDQTLSPNYMQDEVLFPAFGINAQKFWQRCQALVRDEGYDSELAYLKALLDYLGLDRPTNGDLQKLGAGLKFFPGLPEMFDDFKSGLLRPDHEAIGIKVEHYIISSGLKAMLDGSRLAQHVRAIFACEFAEDSSGTSRFQSASSAIRRRRNFFSASTRGCSIIRRM